jgi:hypothetical protein
MFTPGPELMKNRKNAYIKAPIMDWLMLRLE